MKKITGLLVLSILVVLCFGLLWAFKGPANTVLEPQDQNQTLVNSLTNANHDIDLATARRLIANAKINIKTPLNGIAATSAKSRLAKTVRGGTFARSAFDKILAQPGVIGISYRFVTHDDGTPALVLVGVSATGMLMTTGAVEDLGVPCPPECGGTSDGSDF